MRRASRLTRVLLSLLSLILSVSLVGQLTSPAYAVPVRDQAQEDQTAPPLFFGVAALIQTFTAGLTGDLVQIDVAIANPSSATGSVVVQIRNVVGGIPGTTVLASTTIPASSVASTALPFPFTSVALRVPVVAGTQYAIYLATAGNPALTVDWAAGGVPGNLYGQGGPFFEQPIGSGIIGPLADPVAGIDFAFRTYLDVPTAGQPAPVVTQPATNDPNNDDEGSNRRRRQSRNNATRGEDESRTEGDVVGVRCKESEPVPTLTRGYIVEPDMLPYAVIANRDEGAQKILLIRDAAKLCAYIHMGDYVEAEGEKQSEVLFYADDVTIKHR